MSAASVFNTADASAASETKTHDGAPAISIVMPAYNAQEYIAESIGAIAAQTFGDFELVVVDDGSADATGEVVKGLAARDSRIEYILQENSGAAVARNRGMLNAKGKYLAFLDADDLFEPKYLETLHAACEESGAQMAVCKYDFFDSANGRAFPAICPQEGRSGLVATDDVASTLFQITTSYTWDKLFRRDFVEERQLQFQNLPNSNDVFFVLSALAMSDSICFVDEVLVHYRVGTGGSTQDKFVKNPSNAARAFDTLRESLAQKGVLTPEKEDSLNERCLSDFFATLTKTAPHNIDAARKVYDLITGEYFTKWGLRSYPLEKVRSRKTKLQLWSFQRASRDQFLKPYANRASIEEQTSLTQALFAFSLVKAGLFGRKGGGSA